MSRYHALVAARYGHMIVNRHDLYLGRSFLEYGEFSEGEVELFRAYVLPGDMVVEVGANFGAHTVPLARLTGPGGTVVAFEPQRLAFQALCGNVALNSLPHVITVPSAVGAEPGVLHVPQLDPDAEQSIGSLALGGHAEGELVPVATLDRLRLARLDFLKVDVEGMECEVVRGARETITEHRPVLYVECDRPERERELLDLIHGLEYRTWWHRPPLYNPDNVRANRANVFPGIVSLNLLCLPPDEAEPPFDLEPAR